MDTIPSDLPLDDEVSAGPKVLRVCPKPAAWQRLHALLASMPRDPGMAPPPTPYIGVMWFLTTSRQKQARLREQLLWAIAQHCLGEMRHFLQSLDEDEWLQSR